MALREEGTHFIVASSERKFQRVYQIFLMQWLETVTRYCKNAAFLEYNARTIANNFCLIFVSIKLAYVSAATGD